MENQATYTEAEKMLHKIFNHNLPSISMPEIFDKYRYECEDWDYFSCAFFFSDGSELRFDESAGPYSGMHAVQPY